MTITTHRADTIEALRKDIIVAKNEIAALPDVPSSPAVNGFHYIAQPIVEPKPSREPLVRRIAVATCFGCLCGAIFAGGIAAERFLIDRPASGGDTQVGSIEVDYDVPVWVDPELGE